MLDLLHKDDQPVSRETQGLATYLVPLGRLVDNTYQPRQVNDPDHVLGIAKSLIDLQPTLPETRGLQQVPIARIMRWADTIPVPAAAYDDPAQLRRLIADPQFVVEMAFGHSRRLAFDCLAHGVKSIFPHLADTEQVVWNGREFDPTTYGEMPIVLLPLTDQQMWQQAVIENAARRDISAIEKAQALKRAIDELHISITDAAASMDMSRSAASNLLRLLELPDNYQQAIVNGAMSETHGRTLLTMRPALHLLKGSPADLGDMTRRQLETHVYALIAACQPLPPQNSTYRMAYGYHNDIVERQVVPPAWPYDWQPPEQDGIVGACEGCQWRATFTGDPGPRCTQLVAKGTQPCREAKTDLWLRQQMEIQRAAIQRPAAPPPDESVSRETQTIGDDTRPVWETAARSAFAAARAIDADAKSILGSPDDGEHTSTARADTSNAAAAAAPVAPVYVPEKPSETPTWFVEGEQYASAPAVLIDKGLCGPEQCACFVVAFNQYAKNCHVRPDPANAPNMCYGCTSAQRLARRKQELEHGDMTAKRSAIKAENAACREMLRDAFYRLTAQDLWHNTAFMRDLFRADSFTTYATKSQVDNMDALSIQEKIWMHVAKGHCTNYSQFAVDGDQQHWSMAKTRAWLQKIAADLTRPVGGVWAELRPQEQPAAADPEELAL